MTTVGVPTLPTRLSARYETGPVIGRGVGSVVVRAHDTLLGRDAAVKVFRVEADARAGRELGLLTRFDHPGLVPVYDVEEHDGRAFVVMALLDGGSLVSRLAAADDDGLGLAGALRTAATVGGALEHLHRAGVTHRGVTPANVLYDGDGRAHLADFGVAFVADAPRITDTGLTVGSAPYLAPEQVGGQQAGAAADVYALGLVLIEALTGRRAFPGDPLAAAQARLDHGPALPEGLPPEVTDLLTGMTATDPADRPDAATASRALRRALVEAEPPTVGLVATPGVLATGPSVSTGVGALTVVGGAFGRRAPAARRGAPRATGTRGVLVLAGLAASAVLAGTVAIASSGPVAEVSADDRPAVVAGGATVGAPDAAPDTPAVVVPETSAPAEEPGTTGAPATRGADDAAASDADPEPVRRVADPAPSTSTRTTRSEPSRTSEPSSRPTAEPETTRGPAASGETGESGETGADGQDQAGQQEPTTRRGAVGEVLQGVGGLVGGALGGGR